MSKVHGNTTHGMYGTPTYVSWYNMKTRCRSHPNYVDISVCERWASFEAFLQDMGERPEGMTLDRIDNSKGYEPGNCRWVDRTTQSRNRSSSIFLTVDGETKCLSEWAVEKGLRPTTVLMRYHRGDRGERLLRELDR